MMFYDWATAPKFWLDPDPFEKGEDPGVTNALMASAPGHPFWMYVGERMLKSKRDSDAFVAGDPKTEPLYKTFWATGPWFITMAVSDYMKENPEAHAGITEPKYWMPSPLGARGKLEVECSDRAACTKRFPDMILYHHSFGSWLWSNETRQSKELELSMLQRERGTALRRGRSCSR